MRERAVGTLRSALGRADLVAVRDAASAQRLQAIVDGVVVAADAALVTEASDDLPIGVHTALGDAPRVRVCLSAQRPIDDQGGVRDLIAGFRAKGLAVLLVPMNPITDAAVMRP